MLVLVYALYVLGKYVARHLGIVKDGDVVDEAPDMSDEVKDAMSKEMKERANLKRRFSGDSVDEEAKSNVTFNPPAFIQRYQAVQKVLTDPRYGGKLKKVVDFGCSELAFVIYLKNMVGVEEALFVDVDRDTLDRYSVKARPLHVDYLHRRTSPLTMRVLEGSVNHHDKLLEDVDAVVCIELIEHLYPEDVINFPYSIFGFIKPKVAIVTTPNADFNVLFGNMSGFRHWDHKFEWTRSQFEDWAKNIILRFPEYEVTFEGIANGPPGSEHLGACSQMAIFHKTFDLKIPKVPGTEGLLKTVDVQEYPFEVDNRSDEDKILDDATYYIRKFSMNNEEMEEEVPLRAIMGMMKFPVTECDLKEILRNNNWSIEDRESGPVVLVPAPTQYSDYSMEEDNFLDDIDDDNDEVYGRDPGPPANYYSNRANEAYNDIDDEDEDAWGEVPHIIVRPPDRENETWEEPTENENNRLEENGEPDFIGRNNENEPQDGGNDVWGDLPDGENEALEEDNDDSEYANTTSSIFADDINMDDLETESRSSETANSPRDESILLSSFSEIRDSENSEVTRNSCPLTLNSMSVGSNNVVGLSNNTVLPSEPRDNVKFENSEYNANSSPLLVDSTRINVHSEDLLNSMGASATIPSTDETTTQLMLDNGATNEINFDKPVYTSSPHVSSNISKKRKIDDPSAKSFNSDTNIACTNRSPSNVLQNNDSKDDPSSCFEVRECLQINKLESPENVRRYTGTIPKSCKRKVLDIKDNAQVENKLEKISPDTPGSVAISSSPEVMDSGYPNSTSPPDLSPEHDLSSIDHDRTADSESPSIEDLPRVNVFEEVQNRDLDNNNLDGEGNNLEADENRHINDLPINVLENDLRNENDIYDARNGFPAWLLRIH